MRRGDIYIVDLSYGRSGSEQGKVRPAIIVSHDTMNGTLSWGTVIVVPLSTSVKQMQRSGVLVIRKGDGGLNADTTALFHQVTTIDRKRLQKHIGTLRPETIALVDDGLRKVLALSR